MDLRRESMDNAEKMLTRMAGELGDYADRRKMFGYDPGEAPAKQAACLAGAAALARVAELEVDNAYLARARKTMVCSWCGHEFDRNPETAPAIIEHMKTCAMHPMRTLEAGIVSLEKDRDRLRALLLEAQNGGDAFRAPQDWWARVALAGPAPEGGA
jgi:hypothetical protein